MNNVFRFTRLRRLAQATVVGERGNILSYAPPPAKTFLEKVHRKKVKPFQKGDNKTGNFLIDNAGKFGLTGFLSLCFYFYRGWKSGHAEDAVANAIRDQETVGTSEINELRSSNPFFTLQQYEQFSTVAWKSYPTGQLTQVQFYQLIGEKLQHLLNKGTRLPPQMLGGQPELPIKGWYVLERVIRNHPKNATDNTYRLTDLLTSLSLCIETPNLEELLRGLYTVALLDQKASTLTLSMSTFPTLIRSCIGSNLIPSRQQTRCNVIYPMYSYAQATPKDIAKTTILETVNDYDVFQKESKSYMTQMQQVLGFGDKEKTSEELNDAKQEDTPLRNIKVPERFGSRPPEKFVDYVTALVSAAKTEQDKEDDLVLYETVQEDIAGEITFPDFYQLMTSRHLCAMGSCIKKKKKKKKRNTAAEEAEEYVNYQRIRLEAEDQRREKLMAQNSQQSQDNALFIPSETFQGPKDGWYYGRRVPEGLGYHRDYFGDGINAAQAEESAKVRR